jgi:hypothetical protein
MTWASRPFAHPPLDLHACQEATADRAEVAQLLGIHLDAPTTDTGSWLTPLIAP